MMDDIAPEKIYLQWEEPSYLDVSWCEDRVNDTDVAYVRSDIVDELRAELEKWKPTWDMAPPDAHSLVMDEDGWTEWWDAPPTITDNSEWMGDGESWPVKYPNWRETLEERPCET